MPLLKTIPDHQIEYLRSWRPPERTDPIKDALIEFATSKEDRQALINLVMNPDEPDCLRMDLIYVLGRMEWDLGEHFWLIYGLKNFYEKVVHAQNPIDGPYLLKYALSDELPYYPRIGFELLLIDLALQGDRYCAEQAAESLRDILTDDSKALLADALARKAAYDAGLTIVDKE